MPNLEWNQLAVALAGLAVTFALLKVHRWCRKRSIARARLSRALRMYMELHDEA
jgi:hypothetical protein